MFGTKLVQTDTAMQVSLPPSKLVPNGKMCTFCFSFLKVDFSSAPALLSTPALSKGEPRVSVSVCVSVHV